MPFRPIPVNFWTACLVMASLAFGRPAFAEPVDLELVLAVDVSGSMDEAEHALQRDGYLTALRHPRVIETIRSGYRGKIALTYIEWAGPYSQVVVVPWQSIGDEGSAHDFAERLANTPIAFIRGTSISGGLEFASGLFADNGYEGARRVIDISGDGPNNQGPPVTAVRDRIVAQGIIINGLPLLLRPGLALTYAGVDLERYYRECVVGGLGAFVIPVLESGQLAVSVRRKLIREIAGVPPRLIPATFRPVADRTDCLIGERLYRSWTGNGKTTGITESVVTKDKDNRRSNHIFADTGTLTPIVPTTAETDSAPTKTYR
jgi:uncharacterized protein DUF1194